MTNLNSHVRQLFTLFFSVFLLLISTNSFAVSYQVTGPTTPYTWIDLTLSGTNVTPALTDDSVSGNIPIGFTFNYGGTNYTQVVAGSNGWVFFGTSSTAYANTTVATVPVSNVLMPYWDDLNPAAIAGRVKYLTQGSAPNRQFIISYIAVPTYNVTGANTFQIVLNENGSFLYNYQLTNDQGANATIGYQVTTADLVQFSFNTASVPNARTLTWTRIPPALLNLKSVTVVSDPFNNATNPKNIPGAVDSYTINVSNTSQGYVDTGVAITDPIPTNTEMFTGGLTSVAPFTFADGSPVRGLTCAFISLSSTTDCIDFSNNSGATWTYVPITTSDYDPAVTNIRFIPSGVMNGDTAPAAAPYPNFSVSFKVRIK
ncbi:MAG: hypothetical protein H7Z70_05220 [Bacteroidia bacterium]|nr:hypothetical protein [Methylotenera sp.]